jgi:hypothetical protein
MQWVAICKTFTALPITSAGRFSPRGLARGMHAKLRVYKMARHGNSFSGSDSLCDRLFYGLSSKIPNLRRLPLQESCAIFQEGKNRFAYVYHYKRSDPITIWCRGDIAKLRALAGSTFRSRRVQSDVWRNFPGSFKVRGPDEIAAAVRCLFEEAYPQT